MMMAPIKATSSTSEAISKGRAHLVNSAAASPVKAGACGPPSAPGPPSGASQKAAASVPASIAAVSSASGHCRLSVMRGYSEERVSITAKRTTMVTAPP